MTSNRPVQEAYIAIMATNIELQLLQLGCFADRAAESIRSVGQICIDHIIQPISG